MNFKWNTHTKKEMVTAVIMLIRISPEKIVRHKYFEKIPEKKQTKWLRLRLWFQGMSWSLTRNIEVEKGKLVTVSICKWHNSEVIMLFPLWWPNDCVSLWTRCYDTGTAKKLINKSIYSGLVTNLMSSPNGIWFSDFACRLVIIFNELLIVFV